LTCGPTKPVINSSSDSFYLRGSIDRSNILFLLFKIELLCLESKHWNQRIINTNTDYLSTLPLKKTRGYTVHIKLFFSFPLQTVNFTKPFYARPVVLVTPKRTDNNNNANLSGSRCNAVTTWVEVRNTCCDLCVIFANTHVTAQISQFPRDP